MLLLRPFWLDFSRPALALRCLNRLCLLASLSNDCSYELSLFRSPFLDFTIVGPSSCFVAFRTVGPPRFVILVEYLEVDVFFDDIESVFFPKLAVQSASSA